jgi:hypothetical protein
VTGALGIACAVLVPLASKRVLDARNPQVVTITRTEDGGQPAGVGPRVTAPWAGPLNETERQIVGTWSEVLLTNTGRIEVRTTYKSDRTFSAGGRGYVRVETQQFTIEFTIEGTWRVEHSNLVTRIMRSNAQGLAPIGLSGAVPIVSVSDTTLITRDPATGAQSVATRTR